MACNTSSNLPISKIIVDVCALSKLNDVLYVCKHFAIPLILAIHVIITVHNCVRACLNLSSLFCTITAATRRH